MKLRHLLLVGAALMGLSPAAFAGITHVGSGYVTSLCTPGCPTGTSFPASGFSAIASGDAAVIVGYFGGNPGTVTLADNKTGNTYTQVGSDTQFSTFGVYAVVFRATGILNSPTSFTFTTQNSVTGYSMSMDELAGAASFDVSSGPTEQDVANPSESVTTTAANDGIWTMLFAYQNQPTVPTGYTQEVNNWLVNGEVTGFGVAGAAGNTAVTWTEANGINGDMTVVAFKPSAAGPTKATYSPTAPQLLDTAANGATIAGFVVTMSDSSTYSGTNSLLNALHSDALCALSSTTGNANLITSRALTSSDVGSHTCKLQVSENGNNLEQDLTFVVADAVSLTDSGNVPASVVGDVLGVTSSGKFALVTPQAGPPGPQGIQGPAGQNGVNGTNAGQTGLFMPTSSTMTCTQGQSGFDATYIYLCTQNNSWVRFNYTSLIVGGW